MRHKEKTTGKSIRSQKGLTLVEVMIGIVLFSVVATGIFSLSGLTWIDTGCAEAFTEASVQASRQLESMFSAKYVSNDTNKGMSIGLLAGPHDTTEDEYSINYFISDGAVVPNSKSVQMNVSYFCGGRQRVVRYNYILPMRQ